MGRVRWRVVAFVLTGVGVLAFGFLGSAQAQEAQPPVVFARPAVTLPDGGSAGLTLFNNTTAELLLTVRITPSDAFSVESSAASIGPGGSVALRVTDVAARPGAGGRVTVLAATPGPGNVLAPRQGGVARATVSVATPGQPAEPLVSEWSVTSYRFKPWGDSTDNEVMPLRDATSCDDLLLPDGTAGGVSASPGSARVVASCTEGGAPGADVGASLAFPGLAHHTGDYRGDIDLAPGDGGTVALTVRRTDYVLLPLVVALLGVAVAVAAQRRLGRRDERASGDRDAWLLLAEVDRAHRAFAAKADDASWAGYSFKADADDRVRAVLRGVPPELDPGDANDPGDRQTLEPVAVAAAAWPALADRLAELDVAVTEVALKAASYRPADGSVEPACLAASRPLLGSPDPLDVGEALAVAAIVDDAATLTEGWLDWAATVAQLESRVDLLALAMDDLPADHDDQGRLAQARTKLSAARSGLWDAEDLAGLDERGTLTAIRDARTLLDGLDHHVSGAAGPGREPMAAGTPVVRSVSPVAVAGGRGTGGTAGTAGSARRRRPRAGAGTAIALAATGFVAVWSGLSVLYAGEAFGSLGDYVAIFAWGFVAQAVLGTVVALAAGATAITRPPAGGAGAPAGA
jgi:hypothetical protein